MRIGKQDVRASAIATSDAERIRVRGMDLCEELIGAIDFTSYFWLLVTGSTPSDSQRQLADAVLVAIAEHGLVPSVIGARMTYAAAPEALQGAVAAGLLGCGSVILGSAEAAADFLQDCLREAGASPAELARAGILALRTQKRTIPGFGHPQHSTGDPRATRLIALAKEVGSAGPHIAMLESVSDALPDALGRPLPINVNGAIAAVMLDAGFPAAAIKGISLLARTAGLIGHLTEEVERPIGFILSAAAAQAIDYDGP
jgi:citrate synthase